VNKRCECTLFTGRFSAVWEIREWMPEKDRGITERSSDYRRAALINRANSSCCEAKITEIMNHQRVMQSRAVYHSTTITLKTTKHSPNATETHEESWERSQPKSVQNKTYSSLHSTRSLAVAETARLPMRGAVLAKHKWKTIFCGYYTSIFNHSDVILPANLSNSVK